MRRKKAPAWTRYTWRDRWLDRPRTPADAWHLLMASTVCKAGRHSGPGHRVPKFNGGNPVQLCCHCRVIVKYEGEGRIILSMRREEP